MEINFSKIRCPGNLQWTNVPSEKTGFSRDQLQGTIQERFYFLIPVWVSCVWSPESSRVKTGGDQSR